MKLSWGTRIALLYGGFVALIATLVIGSMRQDFDLVSRDYYAREIAYQNTIDASKNQASLSAPVMVGKTDDVVILDFPGEFENTSFMADVHLYAPVGASLDRKFSRRVENGQLVLGRRELASANYTVKITWEMEGKNTTRKAP